ILNDLAIARARQGKTAAAENDFRRAVELDPDEDDYPFNLGLLALQTNDPSAAAGYFREAAQREPDNPEDRALLILSLEKAGRKKLSAGHADAAEKEFRAVLAADPSSAAAHRGLAEIDRRQGRMDDAVKELQASLEARDSAVVRTMLAKIYLEQKKPDLARAEVEKALKLAPNYAE